MISGTEQVPRSDGAAEAGKSLGPACAKMIVANIIAASTISPTADVKSHPDGMLPPCELSH